MNAAKHYEHCNNGDCKRPIFRTQFCLRCWAGVKWTSIRQRVENKNGNNPSYEGVKIGFTKETLIKWVMENPPPASLEIPSIDRIVPELGYSPGNVRWIERNRNSSATNRDSPDGQRICGSCKQMFPADPLFFGPLKRNKTVGLNSVCRVCSRVKFRKYYGREYGRERASN